MAGFDLLADLTAQLASTARLDDIVDAAVNGIVHLGFGTVWIAVLDEQTGMLTAVKQVTDGVDLTQQTPQVPALDPRTPIGRGFRDRRMCNVTDPSLVVALDDDDPVAPGELALPRVIYERLRDRPFACGPLLGSRGQPVGALGVSSYRGRQVIPDELLAGGLLRVFMDQLGIAMERTLHAKQLEVELVKVHAAILDDARLKAIGELAVAVAHDLNNLCGIALLAAGVGLRSPPDAFEVLPRIERTVRAIGDLVGRLQRIGRPSSQAEVADLQQTVEDILIMAKPILAQRSIAIDAQVAGVPPVRCDAVLLHQVVLNLVINAHDALGEVALDRRRITIRAQRDVDTVRLTVADTGPGIAPAMLPHLFRPFNTTKSGGHLGLGLAAAHASLQQYGAQLTGRNAPGSGAVFELVLQAAAHAEQRPAPAPVGERTSGARILAIDDDPDVVFFIHEYLQVPHYEVTTATDSAKAIEIARSRPFDLVLCDLGMPKQSGLEVCRLLRDAGYRGKLVLMTGWDTSSLTPEQVRAGCDALLKKPFRGAELVGAIEALLGAQPGEPPSPDPAQ